MEVEEVACLWLCYNRHRRRRQRQRQFWVHPVLRDKLTHSLFVTLYPKLREYEPKFFDNFRMSTQTFDALLQLIEDDISPSMNYVRHPIGAEEKLVITLSYLATGCSFGHLQYCYRIGKSTVAKLVRQVCAAIWKRLKYISMPEPTKEKWEEVSEGFCKYANFPNCIGAVDGKHIRIVQATNTGSLYFNYKKYFSVLLLAVCDYNYNYLFVDIGAYGKSSDSSVFQESLLYQKLINRSLNIPDPKPISGSDIEGLPHVFVGDDAFGISDNIMRPYVGKSLTYKKKIFNYRLTRARRFIECTFGIMTNKWRIFHRPLNVNIHFAEEIIQACCVLHNYVRSRDGYRFEDTLYNAPLTNVEKNDVPRGSLSANQVRDKYAEYFVTEGKLPWQDEKI